MNKKNTGLGRYSSINTGMIDLRPDIRLLPSQHNVGCCAASAALLAAEIMLYRKNIRVSFSRLYTYYMARKLQNRIGEKGTEIIAVLDSMKVYGACEDRLWPFSHHKVDVEPDNVAVSNGKLRLLDRYESLGGDDINRYLDRGTPVVIGMHIGSRFWSLRGKLSEQDYGPINQTNNTLVSGHAVTIVGYNEDYWIIANSAGPQWGEHGYGKLPFSCSEDIGEAYVLREFAGISAR